MAAPLNRQFILGFIRIHILYHASREAVCGVDLARELARHGYTLGPGTLYPILHSLQTAGYLHCDIQITGGRQRKAYRLTKRGIGVRITKNPFKKSGSGVPIDAAIRIISGQSTSKA